MGKIWLIATWYVGLFRIIMIGLIFVVLGVGVTCNGHTSNVIAQKIYDVVIGNMFEDETLE